MSDFLEKIIEFAGGYDMFPETGLLVTCVSGGADSMCLLEALLEISRRYGFEVCAAHYNHRLRAEESDRDETFVREYCSVRGVPFFSGSGDVRDHAARNGLGIEEAARDMRYGFFFEVAEKTGAVRIATAHTADDNTETILLNFTRGAGTAGLSGIPPKRGLLIRPMLRLTREDVLVFGEERNIPYVEDSSNSLDVFARNKLRHNVIPVLRGINPRLNEAAAATAAILRADESYFAQVTEEFVNGKLRVESGRPGAGSGAGVSASADELLLQPFSVSSRVIRFICGGSLSYEHVMAVLGLCRRKTASDSLSLPGMTVYREYGRIVFVSGQITGADGFEPICPEEGSSVVIPGTGLNISCISVICGDTINKSFTSFLFKYIDLCGKISVRPRLEGDVISFYGQNGTKTLKKAFIEHRIPVRKRALIPVVADDNGVLAVYGLGRGNRAVPGPGDRALQITFDETT